MLDGSRLPDSEKGMFIKMKNKKLAVIATVGTVIILSLCGSLAARTVFAAEERVSITSENSGSALSALADAEVMKVYKNSVYGDKGCTLVLPAGYVKSSSIDGMYQAERYPLDSSNVYYTVSEGMDTDSVDKLLRTDAYKNKTEQSFRETYGSGASVSSYQSAKVSIDGCPAYKIELSCTAEDMKLEQLTYIILADKTYTITYSQSADDERMEDFKKSAETIRMVF